MTNEVVIRKNNDIVLNGKVVGYYLGYQCGIGQYVAQLSEPIPGFTKGTYVGYSATMLKRALREGDIVITGVRKR